MIPNILHFNFGLTEDFADKPFSFIHYMCIKSAIYHNKPEKVYLYYEYEPTGRYWDKVKKLVTLERVTAPVSIFNNPLIHAAHRSDVLRLQKLIERGGIYLDCDVLCIKSFTSLLNNKFVLAEQANRGLCNAVILSEPNAYFAQRWLDEYKTFRSAGRDAYWDEHSVILPKKLARELSSEITILDKFAFFHPLWDRTHVLFIKDVRLTRRSYCVHLFESLTWHTLSKLNEYSLNRRSEFYKIVKSFLPVPSSHITDKQISILTLTHNKKSVTMRCMDSLKYLLDRSDILEWINLDNNSTDGLTQWLIKSFKHEKFINIASNINYGVAGGRARLLSRAKGNVLLYLDSDVFDTSRIFLSILVDALDDPTTGIVGLHGGNIIKDWSWMAHVKSGIADCVTGYCQMFKRSVIDGGCYIDQTYSPYWLEDTDFCLQIKYRLNLNSKVVDLGRLAPLHSWSKTNSGNDAARDIRWDYFVNKWRPIVEAKEKLNNLSLVSIAT